MLLGPWGDDPWTCTRLGANCTLPFSACTQQLSNPYDTDADGSLPTVSVSNRAFLVRNPVVAQPVKSRPTTFPASTLTCEPSGLSRAPCAAGRFKGLGGSGFADSCEARYVQLPRDLKCASCQPGIFGFGVTMYQECAVGRCTIVEQQTERDGVWRGPCGSRRMSSASSACLELFSASR